MVLISLPTYPAKNFLIESPLVYFLVCVLIKITFLVEIPSRPGRRELPIPPQFSMIACGVKNSWLASVGQNIASSWMRTGNSKHPHPCSHCFHTKTFSHNINVPKKHLLEQQTRGDGRGLLLPPQCSGFLLFPYSFSFLEQSSWGREGATGSRPQEH